MKNGLSIIAKGTLGLMALAVLSVLCVAMPELAREEAVGKATPPVVYPFFIGAWILAIPIFVGLFQAFKFLTYIDRNNAFSSQAIRSLRNIKICAIVFGVLILVAAISVVVSSRMINPNEDMPPFLMVGTVIAFISSILATFIAVVQRLLQNVIDMKSENELTV